MVVSQGGLPAIIAVIGRRWLVFVLVALPLTLAVATYVYLQPSQYDSQTTVAFTPRNGGEVGADIITVVLPRYVALLNAPATTQRVAAATGVSEDVFEAADVAVGLDTANLNITVRDADPQRAATGANALAAVAVRSAADDKLLRAEQVAAALPPTVPSAPARGLLSAAGLLAGLLAGLAAAVLAERIRPRVYTVEEAADVSGLEVLGRLPTSRPLLHQQTTPATDDVIGSGVRAALARAERRTDESDAMVVGVTAPTYGQGKTTVALAYAAAAARRGRRVVLVDGDAARSKLSTLTAGIRSGEAADIAPFSDERTSLPTDDGDSWLEGALLPGPVPGVFVVKSTTVPQAADILALQMAPLLKELLTFADQVVVDCPPTNNDDGQVLIGQLPSVVLVARAGSHAGELASSAALLRGLDVKVLGVLFNRSGRRQQPSVSWNDAV